MADVTISVNITEVAKKMKERGITVKNLRNGDFTGWTNTLVDIL